MGWKEGDPTAGAPFAPPDASAVEVEKVDQPRLTAEQIAQYWAGRQAYVAAVTGGVATIVIVVVLGLLCLRWAGVL